MITESLLKLENYFNQEGFSLRFVGGCVRDTLAGITPKDIDIATDATPEQQHDIYKKYDIRCIDTGIKHGTWTIILDKHYEITSLRKDVITDGRHAVVEYVNDWVEDSNRRDFTINAMYMDFRGQTYDYHHGVYDLNNKIVRFVGDADQRIKEDYLRIMRYYRFYARFGNVMYDEQALFDNINGLKQISVERIWSELKQIICLPNAKKILQIMYGNCIFDVLGISIDVYNFKNHYLKPETNLALMCYDFNDVAKKLKLSTYETNLGNFAKKNQHIGVKQAKIFLTENIKQEFVAEALTVRGLPTTEINNWIVPKFPITGDMIPNLEGKELGEELKRLRHIWYDMDFSNDVLKEI